MQTSPHSQPIETLKRTSRFVFFTLFFIFGLIWAGGARAQQPTAQEAAAREAEERAPDKPVAKSIVRGRVTYEDTNRPLRRARLMLLNIDGGRGGEKNVVTDERGEFRITEVAAGSYLIVIEQPGIITPFSVVDVDESTDETSAMAQIKKEFETVYVNGTNSVEVQVKARRGGVITGRVTYGDGDPAVGAQLTLLRKKGNRLARFFLSINPTIATSFKTDDRGVYRIAGLPPGEYIVGASESNATPDMRDDYAALNGMLGGGGLIVSYYQNETSLRAASPVKVEAGQEYGDINVTLIERALHTLSGTVVARQGRTPVGARLSIQVKTESASPYFDSGPSVETDQEGRWTFRDVPDGTYVITVEPQNAYGQSDSTEMVTTITTDANSQQEQPVDRRSRPEPRRPTFVRRQQEVTVSGGDLSNVVIEMSEGTRIRGMVVVEGGKEVPREANVRIASLEGKLLIDRQGYIQPDGSFIIDAVPAGEFHMRLVHPADKYYVKAMTAGPVDLLRETLKVGAGSTIDNVRITVATDVSLLAGRVLSASDRKPVRGLNVMVVPQDPSRWRAPGSFLYGITDADGAFSMSGAPGAYLVIPLSGGYSARRPEEIEAFVRQRAATARQVTLQPNARETVELIVPVPN